MTKIGYARCSTDKQEVTAQRQQLEALGVGTDRLYLDEGRTGTNRDRPRLDQALAAVRAGDTFVVTKLDRLARSVPDALDILGELDKRGVLFALGASTYDWKDPMAKLFLQILAVIAEFEGSLIRQRTREGMAIARAKGKLKGKPPKLTTGQRAGLLQMHASGLHNITELAEMFQVSRPTVYRELAKARPTP
jgi:DNA invertase Pin-like site-specific DNA recombinase